MTGARAVHLPVVVLLFSSVLWGLSWWPLKAFAAAGLSGPMLALLSYGAVGLAGLPWLLRQRPQWLPQARLLLAIALIGGWGNAAFVGAMVLGSVVRVMLLFYLAPVWSVLGGWLFLGEAISRRRAAAVALALAGAFLVVGGLDALAAPWSAADLLALSAGLGFAGNNIVSRAAQAVPTASKTVALCLGCALASGLLLARAGKPLVWPSPALIGGLAAYAFGGLLLVTATWQWSVTRLEAGRSGVIAIAELFTAVLSATWIGNEHLLPREWIGGALIAAAALLEATDTGPETQSVSDRPLKEPA
jgi:drug/metabolite transporter (DMT)-like permease